MWYTLRRTWPSLLKTAMVCGTICYGLTLGFAYKETPPKDAVIDTGPIQANIARHERALQRMAEIRPELVPALAEVYGEPVSVTIENGKPVISYVTR